VNDLISLSLLFFY